MKFSLLIAAASAIQLSYTEIPANMIGSDAIGGFTRTVPARFT